jgi:hypothetical protein
MRELPTHLGGYQCVENGGPFRMDDVVVRHGKPIAFWGDLDGTFNMYGCNMYRKMPVAKQGDLDHKIYSGLRDATREEIESAFGSYKELPPDFTYSHPWETPPPKSEAQHRKERPIASGVLDYFPDALMEVAYCSYMGNKQHNTGEKVTWDRSKSADESDALIRHFLKRGEVDTDGVSHSAKLAWRALAMLQKEIENEAHPTP